MGVPALFRWLSRKYPKIILPVREEEEREIIDMDLKKIKVPVDTSKPNPNGVEFDNLYLDMNGIVHPCTHPEGKEAPETEQEMMLEIFNYTERVVKMVRPRRLLMLAIDGVAPRAKMNQQRSRRFRSAQEAKEKEEARQEALKEWEARGMEVTEEDRTKEAWDSNAITPGTPFMDLLAQSLRYWVVQKMNSDPGWKQIEVIISDANVPGEGEHKIMDFIRRQRSNPGYDPNTRHVIYGLDADLIMLSLATHEPYFRVLREDVFAQDTKPNACRICGQEGHYAAQCTGEAKLKADEHDTKKIAPVKKPFIFLDVSILREYLEVELDMPNMPFHYDLERAIDDWVLLIFFVGNDFLPHLPSLEIREGAIDTLLSIWKDELPRMGGYLTNNGKLEYDRVQIILEGLAKRENDIFKRRREAAERQDSVAKRRKIEMQNATQNGGGTTAGVIGVTPGSAPLHPSASATPHGLPQKPNFDSFEDAANALGFGAVSPTPEQNEATNSAALAGIAGSAHDWVRNRSAIRMANMSAADMLRADMMSARPVKQKPQRYSTYSPQKASPLPPASTPAPAPPPVSAGATPVSQPVPVPIGPAVEQEPVVEQEPLKAANMSPEPATPVNFETDTKSDLFPEANQQEELVVPAPASISVTEEADSSIVVDGESVTVNGSDGSPHGVKRKLEEAELEDADGDAEADEDEDETGVDVPVNRARKVHADGSVDQEDTVRLWQPGYKERYYKQKFGAEPGDMEIRRKVTKAYVEGMAWVLHYYYQGTPSWKWYYPYHFAPFAQDFEDVDKMNIEFEIGQPFKPFEQLMGVFPPASKKHIPEIFHNLMTDTESPILDFYPTEFEIDMNGKRMAWQGVALLPFIDEARLLEAMSTKYSGLTEDETKRNRWGSNALFVTDAHPLYPFIESLYGKRKSNEPLQINPAYNMGLSGSLLPDPSCIPYSTYYCPLDGVDLPDIHENHSLSALYYFPKQLLPHRSVMLPGVKKPPQQLSQPDFNNLYRRGGGRGRTQGGYVYRGSGGGNTPPYGEPSSMQSFGGSYSNGYYSDRPLARSRPDQRRGNYGGPPQRAPYPQQHPGEYGRPNYQGNSYGSSRETPSSHYGGYGNGYSGREQTSPYPPPPSQSSGGYTSGNRGRYGGDRAPPPSRSSYNDGGSYRGYGGGGGGYGGGGNNYGGAGRGGYSSSRGGYAGRGQPPPSSNGYGGYGGYGGGQAQDPRVNPNYGGHGGYGGGQGAGYGRGGGSRGGPPSGQYGGRGYGRY